VAQWGRQRLAKRGGEPGQGTPTAGPRGRSSLATVVRQTTRRLASFSWTASLLGVAAAGGHPGLLAAIRICPLAATKKTSWPSQNVTGFASRRTATRPERRLWAVQQPGLTTPCTSTDCPVLHPTPSASGRYTDRIPYARRGRPVAAEVSTGVVRIQVGLSRAYVSVKNSRDIGVPDGSSERIFRDGTDILEGIADAVEGRDLHGALTCDSG
jgi:hypothetical protein